MSERFLIIKPSSLGDIVHAFPAVSMLSRAYPDAKIDWVAAPAFAGIVKCHPAVDRVILFKRKEMGRISTFPTAFSPFVKELRKEYYTAVIDLQGLLRSAFFGSLCRAKLHAGPAAPREKGALFFYRKRLEMGDHVSHAVLKNCRMMADFLNVPVPEKIVFDFMENAESSAKIAQLTESLSGAAHLVVIAPGARWETKEWPVRFFAESAEAISKEYPGTAFIIAGSPSESDICKELADILTVPHIDLCGKTSLAELVEVIRKADLMLCNDSGPMHIAAAVETPVIPVFGPTDPVLTGPYPHLELVLHPELPCEKCFQRECPDMKCHNNISPDKVSALIRQYHLLNQ